MGALEDLHPGVRRHALRLAEPFLDTELSVLNAVLLMTDDDDSQVRLQLALSLGESRNPRALVALADLAQRHGRERWISEAILTSVSDRSQMLSAELLTREKAVQFQSLLTRLASIVGARRDSDEINQFLNMVVGVSGNDAEQQQTILLKALSDGLGDGRRKSVQLASGRGALQQLLKLKNVDGMRFAFAIARQLGEEDSAMLRQVVRSAIAAAVDDDQPLDSRIAAVRMLANAAWSERQPLVELLIPQTAPELQIAVATSLAAGDEPEAAGVLLARWEGLSPQAQEAITDAMFARPARLSTLLEAMEKGIVLPSSISALRQTQLLESSDAEVHRRASHILQTASNDELAAVVERYQEALALQRDPMRGARIFKEQCSKCHRLGDQGFAVGPDLSGAAGRPDATLLADLLDPSRSIKPGYLVHTAVTVDGKAFAGLLAEESATSITLRREEGKQDKILRKDLQELNASSKSLMPDGLEKLMTPQDVADLIGYLRQTLGPAQPTGVVLFDEQRDFVDKFTQGGGTATIWNEDRFQGEVCLKITPSQRAAARIPGWNYRIVENPQPGEYRYLRLAWKAPGAQGALIELAASGSWPPAESPTRRYYSGKNTTPWQAQQISAATPATWTVATVDLFKDNGAFTMTGLAPTAMGGAAWFDRIELLRALDEPADPKSEGAADPR